MANKFFVHKHQLSSGQRQHPNTHCSRVMLCKYNTHIMRISKCLATGKQKKTPFQECFRGGVKQNDIAWKGTKQGTLEGVPTETAFLSEAGSRAQLNTGFECETSEELGSSGSNPLSPVWFWDSFCHVMLLAAQLKENHVTWGVAN